MQSRETLDMMVRRLTAILEPDHGPAEARSLALLVVRYVTGLSPVILLRDAHKPFPKERLPKVNNILRQLKERMPVQYVLGETEFYGCRIRVSPAVLIPRPETEELVHELLHIAGEETVPFRILDIGTGSGCIAVALAKALPEAEIDASDVSEESLQLARENAKENGAIVHFFREDVLNPGHRPGVTYRYIVSNPPYVPESEKKSMQPEVVHYEPPGALFVPDDDPLLFYRALLDYASEHLDNGGWLMVEAHEKFARKVKDLFEACGMSKVEVKTDINGKERFVKGVWCEGEQRRRGD
ncbi:MAG: peptide chain release factor N(5)-glutamine methyltransferase [Bacteroidales bacterium]|nr:peptide chain release factor N(5)-glutamine methyltransferase [Bacteroidales bacterium]